MGIADEIDRSNCRPAHRFLPVLIQVTIMPLYEFRCDDCGSFEQWRTMAECNDPAICPVCQTVAKRIFSPPAVLSYPLRLKQANSEPQLVKRSTEPQASHSYKSHVGGRPWMISH